MSQKVSMPAPLRALLRLLPLSITLLLLLIAAALMVEIDQPRGTTAWLNRSGLSTPAMLVYTLVMALLAFAFRRDLVTRNLRGIATFALTTSPYWIYCGFATYYLVLVDQIGSRVALVIFWGGYGFCAACIAFVTWILIWAHELELRDSA